MSKKKKKIFVYVKLFGVSDFMREQIKKSFQYFMEDLQFDYGFDYSACTEILEKRT